MPEPDPAPAAPLWSRADRVFQAAIEEPASDREAFVRRACGDDMALLARVQELLAAVAASDGLFESPAAAAVDEAMAALETRVDAPHRVGPYAILRVLGRGGMGTVYLAEREGEGFRQRVAVKVLRRGLDTSDIVARFLRERRILGSLTHPGIARLIDGGATDDGRPYLAMEYVEGEPITAWCDRQRASVTRRLEMFLEVADAVRAAHASLVIHRDLKPSNILVANDRVVLLDFGIAKLLEDDADRGEHTRTGASVLTPDVASPEQLQGGPVTTATDVFQLGVLLCQLLTGERPAARHDADPLGRRGPARRPSAIVGEDAAAHTVADRRAISVAKLRRLLRGDLDTIVLKAVHEEPERRYASVDQLAKDVEHFLAGQPISARPDTWAYRLRTRARRQPWIAPVAGAAALVLVGYIGTVTWYAVRLTEEQATARQEAERAQAVQAFLVDLFRSPDPNNPADAEQGRQITVLEALDLGVTRLRTELIGEPATREALLLAIADVYQNLSLVERAIPLREEALALQEARAPGSVDYARNLGRLATLEGLRGADERSLALMRRRLELALALDPPRPDEVMETYVALAQRAYSRQELDDAQQHVARALALEGAGGVPLPLRAEAYRTQADVHSRIGRFDAAREAGARALALQIEAHGEDALQTTLARVTLAQIEHDSHNLVEARRRFEAVSATLEDRLGPEHWQTLSALNSLALVLQDSGDAEGAVALHRQVLERRRRLRGDDHRTVGNSLQNLAGALTRLGRLDEARRLHDEASRVYRAALGPDNYYVGLPQLSIAGIELGAGRFQAAEQAARAALAVFRKALPEGQAITAIAECRVARALAGQGLANDAAAAFEAVLPQLIAAESWHEYRDECLGAAADFFDARGQSDRAAQARRPLTTR